LWAGILVVTSAFALSGCRDQGVEVEERVSGLGSYVACNSLVLPVAAATASSVQQNHFLASFAVDGDPTTRWSSNTGMPQWLQLDMGARVFVESLQINWQTAFSTSFRIEASDDGVSWATVVFSGATQAGLQVINNIFIDARFLRIFSTGATSFGNVSIIDLQVVGDPNTTCQYTTINCGDPVKLQATSASASSTQFSYTPASAAIDDVFSTRWSSNFTDNEWLAQDLGTPARVGSLRINWEHAFAKSYAIQTGTSLTGPWTTVATETGQFGPQFIDLNVTTRFLRLLGLKRATQYGYSVWEMEVYGTRDLSCENLLSGPWQFQDAGFTPTANVFSILNNTIDFNYSGISFTFNSPGGGTFIDFVAPAPVVLGNHYRLRLNVSNGSGVPTVFSAALSGAGSSGQVQVDGSGLVFIDFVVSSNPGPSPTITLTNHQVCASPGPGSNGCIGIQDFLIDAALVLNQ
jgi:hypothetical protein